MASIFVCSFSFIVSGASGGKGSGGMGSARGAMVRFVMELRKGQQFYVLVGQEGTSACLRVKKSAKTKTRMKPSITCFHSEFGTNPKLDMHLPTDQQQRDIHKKNPED